MFLLQKASKNQSLKSIELILLPGRQVPSPLPATSTPATLSMLCVYTASKGTAVESVVTSAELTGEMSQQAARCRDSTNTGGPWDPGLAKSHASSRFTLGFPTPGECKYCVHLAEGLLPYLRIRRNRQTPYPLIVSVPSSIHIFFLLCL